VVESDASDGEEAPQVPEEDLVDELAQGMGTMSTEDNPRAVPPASTEDTDPLTFE